MRESNIYPATVSNQITESYYFALVGQINNGTCSKKVSKVLRKNCSYEYFSYHLISTMSYTINVTFRFETPTGSK